jgi:hypothetical protein
MDTEYKTYSAASETAGYVGWYEWRGRCIAFRKADGTVQFVWHSSIRMVIPRLSPVGALAFTLLALPFRTLKPHAQYMRYVVRHKWFVFRAGLTLGVPIWRLILHDWTKFLPREWMPYMRFFYGDGVPTKKTGGIARAATPEFEIAWNHHQHKNDHHWQFWIRHGDDGSVKVLPMSESARREMLADWKGAGKAQGNSDTKTWYNANCDNMMLHDDTRKWIESQLAE